MRASDGNPIYVTGMLDEADIKVHAATVNESMASTGKTVTVVHLPK